MHLYPWDELGSRRPDDPPGKRHGWAIGYNGSPVYGGDHRLGATVMLRSLVIEGFRRFERLEMSRLGRVNLLVGINNSGKTSVLEAVHLLAAEEDLSAVYGPALRRGERFFKNGDHSEEIEIDIARLFREDGEGGATAFEIKGDRSDAGELALKAEIAGSAFALRRTDRPQDTLLELAERGGLPLDLLRRRTHPPSRPVVFFDGSFLTIADVISRFNDVVLTSEETVVLDALRIIEPSIERIAAVSADLSELAATPRGGIIVRCAGSENRVPIGHLGEGMWRMLGLALALVSAKRGLLLVDEIDAGLHYSVMVDMWRLVCATAERLGVRVFATTQNSDCWTSLAAAIRESGGGLHVSIQRLEPDKRQAVTFAGDEIVIAAERGIEVR